jgi:hydrogenase/urease accessory protein HupE
VSRVVLLLVGLAASAAFALPAQAHESRPLYIEVTEQAPLAFLVRWKIPPSLKVGNAPDVSMTDGCVATTARPAAGAARGSLRHRRFRCEADPAGTALQIHYPLFNPSVSALVRISRLSGETHSLLASPNDSEIIIPAVESFGSVARDYLALGVRHILEGYDHLLFLVCLLLIAGTARRILITITGFTIAHSITLALSALGVVRVPVPPVEAAIALSIVFLAIEIVRGDKNSLTYRYPIAVAASFGLLHGFGFAAVLGETGLPQTEIPAALFFFNLGVEVGQVIFVAGVMLVYQLVRLAARAFGKPELSLDRLRGFQTPAAYAVGILASFWMIQRVATFWTS